MTYKELHEVEIKRFIERVTETGKPLVSPGDAEELRGKLFNSASARIGSIQSHTDDVAARADYVCKLIERCDIIEMKQHRHAIICISMSPDYSMIMDELNQLTFHLPMGLDNITWGLRLDETLDKEIRMDYALY